VTVDDLERRAEQALGATGDPPDAEARRLAGIEAELRAAEGLRGRPALGALAAFRDRAAMSGAPQGAARAEELLRGLLADAATGILEPPADDAEACFRALARALSLDLEALARTRGPAPMAGARGAMRDRLLVARRTRPPSDQARAAWAKELCDRADVALSSLDEFEPMRAAEIATLVADDLAWHMDEAERQGGPGRRALGRRFRRLRAEAQERDLQARLEARFGRRNVAIFERMVLLLTIAVLSLLAVEAFADLPHRTLFWFAAFDTLACGVFLWDVAVKLRYARNRARWLWRHFFVDVLPSIPFALLLLHPTALDSVYALRALRLARISRVGRYLYVLRPFLRLGRAFAFLSRGVDRLVRGHGPALNRDIVLYPTREERARLRAEEGPVTRLRKLEARVNERWLGLLGTAGGDAEAVAAARLDAFEDARRRGDFAGRTAEAPEPAARDLMAEDVLRRLERLTPAEAEAALGADLVARIARIARVLALPPIRWFPVIRRYVPRLAEDTADAPAVAAASRAAAKELRRHHGRWLWIADLHGSITPAQFVDRVGTAMMKVSFRPAYRLVLFALIVLVLRGIFKVSGLSWLDYLATAIFRFAGVLGSICLALLGVGWWLKRTAGEATAFFEQAAHAQYLALTETFKGRTLERDAKTLERRVLAPERLLRGETEGASGAAFVEQVRQWLVAAQPPGMLPPEVERALLLYRDGLDGAPFTDSDTRTTAQLLGNPSLRNLCAMSQRLQQQDLRQIAKLDLERPTSLLRGPYFWFRLMCRAVAHGVARLLVDYNRHALPLAQLGTASEEEQARYRAWLGTTEVAQIPKGHVRYATTHFTALHFLDDDGHRDREVETLYGPAVLARVRRDRRVLFRRVFGTYPVGKLPRDDRVLNPFRLYQRWLAGGRALLVPLFLALGAARRVRDFFRWLGRCVRELKGPSVAVDTQAAEGADFATAVRKIGRARGPVAEAALRMRVRLDVEYLGVRLPGTEESGLEGSDALRDLRFLDAGASLEEEVEGERGRAERDMRRLHPVLGTRFVRRKPLSEHELQRASADSGSAFLPGGGGVPVAGDREHLRAAACAYLADLDGVRSLLSSKEILAEVVARAASEPLLPASFPRPRLYLAFRRYWKAHGQGPLRARRAAWRAIASDVDGAATALLAWDRYGDGARERGERVLEEILRHPERTSEMLVTLRCVQTLSVLDILLYREHVYRLGGYAESGDDPGGALDLG
jgi:hypothetical protein